MIYLFNASIFYLFILRTLVMSSIVHDPGPDVEQIDRLIWPMNTIIYHAKQHKISHVCWPKKAINWRHWTDQRKLMQSIITKVLNYQNSHVLYRHNYSTTLGWPSLSIRPSLCIDELICCGLCRVRTTRALLGGLLAQLPCGCPFITDIFWCW